MKRTQIDFLGIAIIILRDQLLSIQEMAAMWQRISYDNVLGGEAA